MVCGVRTVWQTVHSRHAGELFQRKKAAKTLLLNALCEAGNGPASMIVARDGLSLIHGKITRPGALEAPPTTFQSLARRLNNLRGKVGPEPVETQTQQP